MRINLKYTFFIIIFSILVVFGIIFTILSIHFGFFKTERTIDNTHTINNYDINVMVNEDNSYDITEIITVNFLVKKHGIYRYFPVYQTLQFENAGKEYMMNYKIRYTDINCDDLIDSYSEDGYYILQIGDLHNTHIGVRTYSISYKVVLGDDRIAEFDQFYYNLIGTGWDTTISNISINVEFKKAVNRDTAYFYVGEYGSSITHSTPITNNIFTYNHPGVLDAFEGITARVVLDEGYFITQKSTIIPDIFFLIGSVILLGLIGIWIWKRNNNNPIIPVVEFTAPSGLTPADAGYIIDKFVNKKDIASLIVYWANKGFVKIIDKNEEDCELIKLKEADESFKGYEKNIFEALFKDNESINLTDTNESAAIAIKASMDSVALSNKDKYFSSQRIGMRFLFVLIFSVLIFGLYTYLGNKLFLQNLNIITSLMIALAVFLGIYILITTKGMYYTLKKWIFISSIILVCVLILVPLILTAIWTFDLYLNPLMLSIFIPFILLIGMYLILKINVRNDEGNKITGSLLGLRQFILVTEQDRIKMLVKENPSLFYEILPYAYVLGVSDKWIKKFEQIKIAKPEWYNGHRDTFLGYYILATMNKTNAFYTRSLVKFNSNKANSVGRSSGKDFGNGGGFSGGGFGGGGGGSW